MCSKPLLTNRRRSDRAFSCSRHQSGGAQAALAKYAEAATLLVTLQEDSEAKKTLMACYTNAAL